MTKEILRSLLEVAQEVASRFSNGITTAYKDCLVYWSVIPRMRQFCNGIFPTFIHNFFQTEVVRRLSKRLLQPCPFIFVLIYSDL